VSTRKGETAVDAALLAVLVRRVSRPSFKVAGLFNAAKHSAISRCARAVDFVVL
jgi:hypothetical protein